MDSWSCDLTRDCDWCWQLTGGADIYLNFTVSGLLEIPAYLAALVILRCWGRR